MSPPPARDDAETKYEKAKQEYEERRMGADPSYGDLPRDEGIAVVLDFAIRNHLPGFAKEDEIRVQEISEALSVSRVTVSKAMAELRRRGLVTQEHRNSPYRVASIPVFHSDLSETSDGKMSLTEAETMSSTSSYVAELRAVDLEEGGELARFYSERLGACPDRLTVGARQKQSPDRRPYTFKRLRVIEAGTIRRAALIEFSFLHLEPAEAERVRKILFRLQEQDPPRVSVYDVLQRARVCEREALHPTRTRLQVRELPELAARSVAELAPRGTDQSQFEQGTPILEWEYALISLIVGPLICFSICYVDTNAIDVRVRRMDTLIPSADAATR